MNRSVLRRIRSALIAPALAVAVAIVVSSIALLASGHSPIDALRAMITFVDSKSSFVTILNKSAPLYVVSLGVAIGFKMNLFNIGADGQYRLAALIAAAAGAGMNLPRVIQIVLIILIAMAVGGAWAAIPGVLKVTRGVNEVVSTIMLNFVATGISAFLLTEYFRNKRVQNVAETRQLPKSGRLPTLNGLLDTFGFHLPRGTVLNGYLPIAILVGVAFYLLVWRTQFGYELRMTGANAAAARTAGVNSGAMVIKTIVISGMLAGLAAMGFLLCDFPKYNEGFKTQSIKVNVDSRPGEGTSTA